jgi:hypothetical protein
MTEPKESSLNKLTDIMLQFTLIIYKHHKTRIRKKQTSEDY